MITERLLDWDEAKRAADVNTAIVKRRYEHTVDVLRALAEVGVLDGGRRDLLRVEVDELTAELERTVDLVRNEERWYHACLAYAMVTADENALVEIDIVLFYDVLVVAVVEDGGENEVVTRIETWKRAGRVKSVFGESVKMS